MISEASYLAAKTLSAIYILTCAVRRFLPDPAVRQLGPLTPYLLPWVAFALVPVFLYTSNKHFWLRSNRVHKTKPGNVYPHRDPILGVDWMISASKGLKAYNLLETWDGLFASIGNSFWHLAFGKWILLTNEPENLKVLLSTQFESWPIGGVRQTTTVITLGPHAIFSVNGKEWQQGRALIKPSFVRNQVADLECQDRHVERFLAKIPRDGSSVDLQKLLYLMTMDSATDFMFGYSTEMLLNPTKETSEFTQAFDHALYVSASRARLGWISYLIPDKKLDHSVRTCQRFIDRYVAKASADEKLKERPYLFLHELLQSGASMEHIRDQLLAIIIGGRDTSASTLSALFWTLARRPDIVKKIQDEIADLDGQKPTWEDLKSFRYVNMALKETLRLWAPVVTNMRCAAKDTVLPKGGGADGQSPLFVPKGTAVRWSLHSLHRRKDIFGEDAHEFRPERWETLRTSWEYLPFSGGPRTCIGQQFALTQMAYVVVRVFQTFETVEPKDERPMLHTLSTTTSLLNGCHVKFEAC
ncbi:unnamed protein product [Clonostachys rhizophaga]|uniref:Cytochrome P450 n=1 Tax=Clonostachys rhizophaga TaxID=160324 RepID=A0A9N9YMY3_9HYPO|nr:unnamed protein product [Clonostachys rhizophaga]